MILEGFSSRGTLVVCVCAITLCSCFLSIPCAFGGHLVNPSFELYDPNGGPVFDTATDWLHENYAADVNALVPKLEYFGPQKGNFSGWPADIVSNGLAPIDGERLLMLSTGHINPVGVDGHDHAKAWQHITAQDGDRIYGYYFFGTGDFINTFDDYASITLVDTSAEPNDIEIMSISVSDPRIGNHGSLDGWEPFEYVFDANTAGEYDLTFYVTDKPDRDNVVNSYLGIDNLQHCSAPTWYGDIDGDCRCDNAAFAILSEHWLYDCTDPNNATIPNGPVECTAWTDSGSPGDLDNDKVVDISDLIRMALGWATSGL